MRINSTGKIVQSAAVASVILLALNASPLQGQDTLIESTTESKFAPCWLRSNLEYQHHPHWMTQGQARGRHRQGNRGWGHHQQGGMYNPNTVETINGKVIGMDTLTLGMSHGVHLQLQTNNEIVDVHVGPVWYLENQDIRILPDDKIEVTGSLTNFNGQSTLIAAQIKKGEATLTLRNESGFPVWQGGRRHQFNR